MIALERGIGPLSDQLAEPLQVLRRQDGRVPSAMGLGWDDPVVRWVRNSRVMKETLTRNRRPIGAQGALAAPDGIPGLGGTCRGGRRGRDQGCGLTTSGQRPERWQSAPYRLGRVVRCELCRDQSAG
jgi:hypothetical protein